MHPRMREERIACASLRVAWCSAAEAFYSAHNIHICSAHGIIYGYRNVHGVPKPDDNLGEAFSNPEIGLGL